jgi:peptide/nickel transport system substrate-binding protein
MIPDAQTAANALLTGEVDWMEIPLPDLIPLLKSSPGIVTGNLDAYGQIMVMRPNHTQYPTSDPAIRHAMLAAVDQKDVMAAVMGGDPANAITPIGFLQSGKPEVDQAGMQAVRTRHSPAQVKAMLDKAGYKGEQHRAAASHRPHLLQPHLGGRLADAVGVWIQYRRPGDGLGHGAVPPHQP